MHLGSIVLNGIIHTKQGKSSLKQTQTVGMRGPTEI